MQTELELVWNVPYLTKWNAKINPLLSGRSRRCDSLSLEEIRSRRFCGRQASWIRWTRRKHQADAAALLLWPPRQATALSGTSELSRLSRVELRCVCVRSLRRLAAFSCRIDIDFFFFWRWHKTFCFGFSFYFNLSDECRWSDAGPSAANPASATILEPPEAARPPFNYRCG